jgi:spore germination cell wall hydrolase CwlJ-like protein
MNPYAFSPATLGKIRQGKSLAKAIAAGEGSKREEGNGYQSPGEMIKREKH